MKRQMASADDQDVCMIFHLQPFSQANGIFSEEDFLDFKAVMFPNSFFSFWDIYTIVNFLSVPLMTCMCV